MKINYLNIILIVAVLVLGYLVVTRKPDRSELDLYKKEYEQERLAREAKFKADSILFAKRIDSLQMASDSVKTHWNKESHKLQKTIRYYEIKIKSVDHLPIDVVDHSLDSLFRSGHN